MAKPFQGKAESPEIMYKAESVQTIRLKCPTAQIIKLFKPSCNSLIYIRNGGSGKDITVDVIVCFNKSTVEDMIATCPVIETDLMNNSTPEHGIVIVSETAYVVSKQLKKIIQEIVSQRAVTRNLTPPKDNKRKLKEHVTNKKKDFFTETVKGVSPTDGIVSLRSNQNVEEAKDQVLETTYVMLGSENVKENQIKLQIADELHRSKTIQPEVSLKIQTKRCNDIKLSHGNQGTVKARNKAWKLRYNKTGISKHRKQHLKLPKEKKDKGKKALRKGHVQRKGRKKSKRIEMQKWKQKAESRTRQSEINILLHFFFLEKALKKTMKLCFESLYETDRGTERLHKTDKEVLWDFQSLDIQDIWVYPSRKKGKNRKPPAGSGNTPRVVIESEKNNPIGHPSDSANGQSQLSKPPTQFILTSGVSVFAKLSALPITTNLSVSVSSDHSLITRLEGRRSPTPLPILPARHPQYSERSARMNSFTSCWPTQTKQDISKLTVYGFYYTGRGDLVRCFHCGIGLKDWSEGDNPLMEHIKNSIDCHYLKLLLGEPLFNSYRSSVQEASGNRQDTFLRNPHYKRPELRTVEARLATFTTFPRDTGQNPQNLADAGLYFTGTNDLCRCFACDGGLQRWDDDDNAWVEHARWFPHCRFVLDTKGIEFVQAVQATVLQAQLSEDPPEVPGMANLTKEDIDPLRTEAAKQLKEMGYSDASVLLAVHEFNGNNKNTRDLKYTAEDLIQILIGRQERNEPIEPIASEEQGATGGTLGSNPEFENQWLKHILKCEKCKENDCNILFLPCTHHRLCEACAENISRCPNCGRKIEEKLKTFMS